MDAKTEKAATDWVQSAFSKLAETLLAGRPGPPQESLVGMYADAAGDRSPATIRILRPYLKSLKHHLDARESAAKADVLRALHDPNPAAALQAAQDRALVAVRRVLETESTALRNVGSLVAVGRAADRLGVDDPILYFVTSAGCCAECRRLFWAGDKPRVWRESELGTAYHKVGDPNPKVGGLHPNCRCSPVLLPSGYGFQSGRITYRSHDHDELADQRGESEPPHDET